jgi:hypothetical protein
MLIQNTPTGQSDFQKNLVPAKEFGFPSIVVGVQRPKPEQSSETRNARNGDLPGIEPN